MQKGIDMGKNDHRPKPEDTESRLTWPLLVVAAIFYAAIIVVAVTWWRS